MNGQVIIKLSRTRTEGNTFALVGDIKMLEKLMVILYDADPNRHDRGLVELLRNDLQRAWNALQALEDPLKNT